LCRFLRVDGHLPPGTLPLPPHLLPFTALLPSCYTTFTALHCTLRTLHARTPLYKHERRATLSVGQRFFAYARHFQPATTRLLRCATVLVKPQFSVACRHATPLLHVFSASFFRIPWFNACGVATTYIMSFALHHLTPRRCTGSACHLPPSCASFACLFYS